uniref:Nodule-specific cysteine-rich peptide L11 n=1 Tax=Lens culinaris TaxID=3864 RepID=A0A7T8DVC3_LENCU|nr:nodule-specific cysteine-rich peptide L11 [Lens culinaris]
MFVYALIVFLLLFLIEASKKTTLPCNSYYDCPRLFFHFAECADGCCVYWPID